MSDAANQLEADALIVSRIAQLRALTFAEVAALPEAAEEEAVISNHKCSLAIYVRHSPYNLPGRILVTVQVDRPGFLGMVSVHDKRGLVFSPDEGIREATDEELQDSGG